MTDADRIRLAKARGWNNITDKHLDRDTDLYVLAGLPPNTRSYGVRTPLPDPFRDANDCEALIRFLVSKKYYIGIQYSYDSPTYVEIFRHDTLREDWEGDDWKAGVCELALKVIDD